jgi:hypothetical protein
MDNLRASDLERYLFAAEVGRWGYRLSCHLIALCVLSGSLVLAGCGGGEEPVEPAPVEDAAPVAPPPPEPEPEPEPEPGPDISEVRVPADHPVWAPEYVGVLLGLNGELYEGYNLPTVQGVQQALSDQGFYPGEVDSDFDRDTMEAVADFQAAYELYLTGIPTPRTRAALIPPSDQASVEPEQGFLVQVGVFSNPANSQRLATRLRDLSFEVQTELTDKGQAVRVGPFPDRATAEQAARAIQEATSLSPLVKTI